MNVLCIGVDTLRVVSLESRLGGNLAGLLKRNGCEPIEAPSMQEVPLEDQTAALAHADTFIRGDFDALVLLTGVGFRMLLEVLSTRHPREQLVATIGERLRLCRGPKPVAVLKEIGLTPSLVAPEPNTYRELLAAIDDRDLSLVGKRLLVQEYGKRNEALLEGLRQRGARVTPVPVYAWRMPDDTGPLARAVDALVTGAANVVLFTSQQQLSHLLALAEAADRKDELLGALRDRVAVASVGPVTSEALVEAGLPVDIEPQRPKMGPLVKAIAAEAPAVLARKSSR